MWSQSYSPQHLMLWDAKLPFYTEPVPQHFGFSHQTVQGSYKNQTCLTTAVPLCYSFCGSNSKSTDVSCSIKLLLLAEIIYPISFFCSSPSDNRAPAQFESKMGSWLCLSFFFLVWSALMVNCPWLNQLLSFPLTSFLLAHFITSVEHTAIHSMDFHTVCTVPLLNRKSLPVFSSGRLLWWCGDFTRSI